jgi:glutamyl-tRNA synthetase
MSIDDMIKSFSLDRVNKSGARFDIDKAKWINSQHLKRTNNCCLKPFIKVIDNRYSDDKLNMIIDLAKDRSSFKGELNNTVDIFYNDPIITDFKKIDDNFIKVFSVFILDDINFDSTDTIKDGINSICNGLGIKIGKVMPGLRTALVGGISGPDLVTTMFILGKDTAISRISSAIQSVSMVL